MRALVWSDHAVEQWRQRFPDVPIPKLHLRSVRAVANCRDFFRYQKGNQVFALTDMDGTYVVLTCYPCKGARHNVS